MKEFKIQIKDSLGTDANVVIFEASSPLAETRNAHYEPYPIIHLPTDILAYRNTSSRQFSITGKFVSRNVEEAVQNLRYLNLIRSWILPDFGNSGSTPPVVYLSAYNHSNVDNVPVVIKNYAWTYTDDTDYIFDKNNMEYTEPMPVIGLISIDLIEIYTPDEITGDGETQQKWKMKQLFLDAANITDFGGEEQFRVPDNISFGDGERSKKFPGLASRPFGLPSVGEVLNKTVGPILDVIHNPAVIFNSPQVKELTSQISSVNVNEFISGINPSNLANRITTVTTTGANPTVAAADTFGRNVLPNPGPSEP